MGNPNSVKAMTGAPGNMTPFVKVNDAFQAVCELRGRIVTLVESLAGQRDESGAQAERPEPSGRLHALEYTAERIIDVVNAANMELDRLTPLLG